MFKAKEIEGELKYAVRRQEETIYYKRLRMANPEMSRFKDLILYNLEAGEAVLTDNNDIRVYTDGKEKFRALIEEMKQRIDISTCSITLSATMNCGRK